MKDLGLQPVLAGSARKLVSWIRFWAFIFLSTAPCGLKYSAEAAEHLAEETVTPALDVFYENFLGRPLSKGEKDQIAKEFLGFYGGSCSPKCAAFLKTLKEQTERMRDYSGKPEDLIIRHSLITQNHFSPASKNSLMARLLSEPDPVRFADPKSKRLMTEKDIIAVVNLQIFANSQSGILAEERKLSPKEHEDVIKALDQSFGGQKFADELPPYYLLAAELWAGLKREWPKLSKEERQAALDYIKYKSDEPMPVPLYQRLLGLKLDEAQRIETIDRLIQLRWNVRRDAAKILGLTRDKFVLDQINAIINRPR